MSSLAVSSISWANVQARVQPPRPLSPRWAKDRARVLQDIYWRMRLVGLVGVLADGTTWSVCVPPEEKMLPHVDWWNKRWVQFNFSSPVASNFMVYARCARAYLDFSVKFPFRASVFVSDFSRNGLISLTLKLEYLLPSCSLSAYQSAETLANLPLVRY